MADYSGWWSCPECPAHGDGWKGTIVPHDETCMVWIRSVQSRLDRKLKELEEEKRLEARREKLRAMTDDELIDYFFRFSELAGSRYEAYARLKEKVDLAREVIVIEKRLSNELIRKQRERSDEHERQ